MGVTYGVLFFVLFVTTALICLSFTFFTRKQRWTFQAVFFLSFCRSFSSLEFFVKTVLFSASIEADICVYMGVVGNFFEIAHQSFHILLAHHLFCQIRGTQGVNPICEHALVWGWSLVAAVAPVFTESYSQEPGTLEIECFVHDWSVSFEYVTMFVSLCSGVNLVCKFRASSLLAEQTPQTNTVWRLVIFLMISILCDFFAFSVMLVGYFLHSSTVQLVSLILFTCSGLLQATFWFMSPRVLQRMYLRRLASEQDPMFEDDQFDTITAHTKFYGAADQQRDSTLSAISSRGSRWSSFFRLPSSESDSGYSTSKQVRPTRFFHDDFLQLDQEVDESLARKQENGSK